MDLIPLSTGYGFAPSGRGAFARRLRRLAFHADGFAARAWARCDRAMRVWSARRLAHEMQNWPDERLKDIGISRAELIGAVAGLKRPFHWVPDSEPRSLDRDRFGH